MTKEDALKTINSATDYAIESKRLDMKNGLCDEDEFNQFRDDVEEAISALT